MPSGSPGCALLARSAARRPCSIRSRPETSATVVPEGMQVPPRSLVMGMPAKVRREIGVPILNLAKAGDEVRYMLGVEERTVLTQQLTAGSPAGGPRAPTPS